MEQRVAAAGEDQPAAARVGKSETAHQSVWRDIVCRNFIESSPSPADPDRFIGKLSTRRPAGLDVASIMSSAQTVSRSTAEIDRSPSQCLFFIWQVDGQGSVEHDGGATTLGCGDGVLFDPNRPYRLTFDDDFRQICVKVPPSWLRDRCVADIDKVLGHKLGVPALHPVLGAATAALMIDNDEAAAPAVDMFLEILGRSIYWANRGNGGASSRILDHAERLRQTIARHYADENLTPSVVAVAMGCSLRQVHKICASLGTTFGRLVLEVRLGAASRALAGGDMSVSRISDIAYECGFNDLSHFCRSFKARYGRTPRDYRRGSA